MSRVVKLPQQQFIMVPTGRTLRVRDLADGSLFFYDGHVWGKISDTDVCLSELDDESGTVPWSAVENLEVTELALQEPWQSYQPQRQREDAFYDIKLRDGTVVECCWPEGEHWHPMKKLVTKKAGKGSIADYRVIQIRGCKPPS
jgi:hypothetical protein